MLSFVKFPAQVINFLLGLEISASEVAGGVCLALFMGFVPFNGSMTLFLFILFFFLRINKLTTLLTLPFFKLLYVLGVGSITNSIGEYLLIKADFLNGFWAWLLSVPVIAYLDVNNTLVAGGLALALLMSVPSYFVTRKLYLIYIEKYIKRFLEFKVIKKMSQYTYLHKLILALEKIRSKTE